MEINNLPILDLESILNVHVKVCIEQVNLDPETFESAENSVNTPTAAIPCYSLAYYEAYEGGDNHFPFNTVLQRCKLLVSHTLQTCQRTPINNSCKTETALVTYEVMYVLRVCCSYIKTCTLIPLKISTVTLECTTKLS